MKLKHTLAGPRGRLAVLALAAATMAGCATELQKAENRLQRQQRDTPVAVTVQHPPFDEAQARQALAKGSATIKGVLYHRIESGGPRAGSDAALISSVPAYPMANVEVWLFPATAHMDEIVRLQRENRSQRRWGRAVQLQVFRGEPAAYELAMRTRTDANGLFEFAQIRPGRYTLRVDDQHVRSSGSNTYPTGTSYQVTGARIGSGGGVTPVGGHVIHTATANFRVETKVAFDADVEVAPGQALVEIDARMRLAR